MKKPPVHLVEFDYAPGDSIRLKDLECHGTVTACLVEPTDKQYRVVWYSDGQRRCEWLFAFEIEPPRKPQ